MHRHERPLARVLRRWIACATSSCPSARPLNQNRGLRRRGLTDDVKHLLHRVRLAHDVFHPVLLVELALKGFDTVLKVTRLERTRHQHVQMVEIDGFGQKVIGTLLHSVDGCLD